MLEDVVLVCCEAEEPEGPEPQSADGVGLSGFVLPRRGRGKHGSTDYNRGPESLWSLGDCM